jgi:hypothetical protein
VKLNFKPPEESFLKKIWPWIGSILLFPFLVYFTLNIGNYLLIDTLNLLIHEGGHGVFKMFGKFFYTLGGTLMQIIIPSMFIVFYFFKKIRFGAQAFLAWLGQNLLNISNYAADARAQKLPLLGGNRVYHDWNYLLGELGLLEYDKMFGEIFVFLGISAFLISLLIPLLIKDYKPVDLSLNV